MGPDIIFFTKMPSEDELSSAFSLYQMRRSQEAVDEEDLHIPTSWWTPPRIREAMEALPAVALYPDLAARAADILEGWYHRFPLRVWSRMVKFADSGTGQTHRLPKVLKEFNES